MKPFQTQVSGKWILAGEHSVLRGSPALVFPLSSRKLSLDFTPCSKEPNLRLHLEGEHGEELQLLFWGILEKACDKAMVRRSQLTGDVRLSSSLPVGAGLGASAALSVAMTRWFHSMNVVTEKEMYEFARNLENLFHGESSGVDIAVTMSGTGLKFLRNGPRTEFAPKWKPRWYISYSGARGVTVECVNKVKGLFDKDADLAASMDAQMAASVELAEQALNMDEQRGMPVLIEALNKATECFQKWGLIEGALGSHMQWLRDAGAVAVKPTGSGNGGYVLSLWDREPASDVSRKLISC